MKRPDLAALREDAEIIVRAIGKEAVVVYLFVFDEFARGPVDQNCLFQFVYRSFYGLDNAGLTPEFQSAYFECMEAARSSSEVDLAKIVKELRKHPNRKGQPSLQFSFATKLAHTINPTYPIYSAEVATCFAFRPRYDKPFESRLPDYLAFYESLRKFYEEVTAQGSTKELTDLFERTYSPIACRVPVVKVLDFIFWSAAKVGRIGK